MATFCGLAYLPFDAEGKSTPVNGHSTKVRPSGPAELAQRLADRGFKLAQIFDRDNVQAFLAVNPSQFAVLAFRGCASPVDWRIGFNALNVPMDGFPRVRVHRGFWEAFWYPRLEIMTAVDEHVPASLGLYITGHSLGGALAQIASAVLERDNLAACYTFGSPRVATQRFDVDVKCPNYRLINHFDLVPGVPLPGIMGYYHAGDPRLLARDPRAPVLCRRDHRLPAWLWVQMRAAIGSGVTNDLFDIADHRISSYASELEMIAGERAKPAAGRRWVVRR